MNVTRQFLLSKRHKRYLITVRGQLNLISLQTDVCENECSITNKCLWTKL